MPFKPSRRHLHTATYVDNKLYILSGFDDSIGIKGIAGIAGKQFFYLDVSVPFNTQEILWHDLTNINLVPSHIGAGSVKGGTNNNTIVLCGGRYLANAENKASVYTFDTRSNSWSIPTIIGESYIRRRRDLTAIINDDGKIYLFGGSLIGYNIVVNDMLILDTINLSWGKSSTLNAPIPRVYYGADLLPNQTIIYIGGETFVNQSLTLNEVYMYDTINDNWSTKKTSGSIPSNRAGLSAVLGLDGQRVIIFGGYRNNRIISAQDSLYTLNINTFEWTIPKIFGNIPGPRCLHKANLIGNYMVISFGMGYQQSESDILLLDISNNDEYKWVINFNPPISSSSPTSPTSPSSPTQIFAQKSAAAIIGIVIGSLISSILLTVGIFFLYKWTKNRRIQKNETSTSDNYNLQRTSVITATNNYNQSSQGVISTTLTNNKVYNHGRENEEIMKIHDNEDNPINDENIISEVTEIKNHGQESISVNNNQSSSIQNINNINNIDNNVVQYLKDEMIQVVRQEVNQLINSDNSNNNY
ncbi:hypothetical protein C1645_856866 [Glomus cerebriforme]|uniref:Attractin/MKLN-like beta-propeller domain-containing protein n=1 Tax=Glomus cerebriforme TaxID=658196 RepID=A0A397TJU6_9GLOM|nr:hypothetical protein C1645_856866 [Glomus cerebriforme]